jgi:hypothetical protein
LYALRFAAAQVPHDPRAWLPRLPPWLAGWLNIVAAPLRDRQVDDRPHDHRNCQQKLQICNFYEQFRRS